MTFERGEAVRVHKYALPPVDRAVVSMPAGAEVLCVQAQHDEPFLWAKVDTEAPLRERAFYVVGTGHMMPVRAGAYVGTVQLSGGALVFHVFEED